jgi:hypothetical protein
MKVLQMLQVVLIILAAVVLIWGILTGLNILPAGSLLLTTGGLQRMANTLLLFSIGLGVYILVCKKTAA